MKIVILIIMSFCLFVGCCKQKSFVTDKAEIHYEWEGCLSVEGMSLAEKIQQADSLIAVSISDIQDNVVEYILNTNEFSEHINDELPWVIIFSEDKRVLLLTIPGGGTMVTGTSYLRYQKQDGSFTIKKVAYVHEDPEGGVDFPAFYNEIHVAANGYVMYGVFAFSTQDGRYKNTLGITNEFLESENKVLPLQK